MKTFIALILFSSLSFGWIGPFPPGGGGGGGSSFTFTTISSNVTLACNSYNFVNTTAPRSLTLPAPATNCVIYITDISGQANTNNISILQHASEQIEGVATTYVYQANYGALFITSDTTNWWFY